MKSFFRFINESIAVQQATRMGLKSDGHGGWYDKNGEFVAKTEKGQLKFFNKRQRIGKQDPPQSDQRRNSLRLHMRKNQQHKRLVVRHLPQRNLQWFPLKLKRQREL